MRMRHLIVIAVLSSASGWAQACLFATSTPPEGWYQWAANGLFAGDVTAVGKDETKPVDIITVRVRSEEHTSELQSRLHLVCRLLLEKKKNSNLASHQQASQLMHEMLTQPQPDAHYLPHDQIKEITRKGNAESNFIPQQTPHQRYVSS